MIAKVFLAVAAMSAPLVAGHGYMGLPKTQFKGGDITAPAGTIESSALTAPAGKSFTTSPDANTEAFTAALKASEYKSLKDLIVKKGANIGECGNSVLGDPQPLPDAVEWTHGAGEGFTASHQGPCEVWCDDQMAFHDDNCAKNFPSAPAKLPYDKSKCAGAKKLTTYWLALHSPSWQVYIGCAALQGGGSSGGGSTTPSTAPSSAPAPSANTPTVTPAPAPSSAPTTAPSTPAPSSSGNDEDCDDDLPIAGDDDCDDDLPIAGDEDCDDDLPIAGDDDCDDDLPIAGDDCDEDYPIAGDSDSPPVAGDSDKNDYIQRVRELDFDELEGTEGEDSPGKVFPEDY